MDFQGKKVTVVGLGKSGLAAALLLHKIGAEPRITDNAKKQEAEKNAEELSKNNIPFELGTHTEEFIRDSEIIVASPGVPNENFVLVWAKEKNIPVIGEIELAYSQCKAPVIAISGTNGKSTVTTLIGEILNSNSKNACVSGNIGIPFSSKVLELDENSVVVLEISSFQLERIKTFKPKVSCLLNVTQDHFDRYEGLSDYMDAKKKIFSNQDETDYAILNFDSPKIKALKDSLKAKTFYFSRYRLPKEYDGAYVENGEILIRQNGRFQWVATLEDLKLEGGHNIHNYLASALAAFLYGLKPESMAQALYNFKTLPHRFETVDIINGVRFVDDSKATNVDSVIKALDCCRFPVVLIAGGRDKESDYRAETVSVILG